MYLTYDWQDFTHEGRAYRARLDGYKTDIEAERTRFAAAVDGYRAGIEGYRAMLEGKLKSLDAEIKEAELNLEHAKTQTMIDQAEVEVFFNDLTGDVADVLVANAGVVGALGSWIATFGEAERTAVLVEEIFLLKSKPGTCVVKDGGAVIGDVRSAVSIHNFTHDQHAVLASAVRIHGHGLEHAVGTASWGLLRGTAVEAPEGKFFKRREAAVFFDLSFAAQIRHRSVTVEPEVFEFVFSHG